MWKQPQTSRRQQLPPDFASRLLDAELELENNCTLAVLQGLLDLYQEAVEFYELKDDLRYLDFQQRIHAVLVKPDIQALLKAPQATPRQEQTKTEQLMDKKAKLDKFKRSKTLVMITSNKQAPKGQEHEIVAEKAVAVVTVKSSETVVKTKEGVKQQQTLLEQRRRARRTKHESIDWTSQTPVFLQSADFEISPEKTSKPSIGASHKRTSSTSLNVEFIKAADFESDKSGGHTRLSVAINELETKLEEIMERSYSAKSTRLGEIKQKYEAEMRKVSADAGDFTLRDMLIAQMKKLMDDELKTASGEFDARRKEEIRSLKATLN
jgi:actin-related protein